MLSKHPDKCRFPHGHSRKVECVFSAESLDQNEMVCDFKVVKGLVAGTDSFTLAGRGPVAGE